ncbi:BnaC09g42200D [Brassica napus]|uniref:BnaC09g42200D protein n=1 Tax=Brassica napus TaxID=3708 RepID=A0A078GP65_BRANA|nr:BnaC09g42200D [Brassica napus]
MMMTTGSKKNKTTVTINPQASSYDVLPLDLLMEIIGRLPVKSIARFLLVCKLWATTIRSRDFIKSFPLGSCSSHEPRFLIAFNEQFIVNPTTGKSIALPRVRTRRKVVKSFFGYDSVSDEYKVLCMSEAHNGPNFLGPSSQHQIFTLGAKKRSWRMVECSIPHCPCSSGVCIDGVIYYMAKTGTANLSQLSLVSFDSRCDKFDLVTGVSPEILLNENQFSHVVILNFEGKVAITTKTTHTFDVWVMDQNAEERKWLKKLTFSVEPWKSLFHSPSSVSIKGITQTGEFILVPYYYNSYDVYVGLYNHYTDTFRKVKAEGNEDNDFIKRNYVRGIFFSDCIESVRFL